MFKKAYFQFIDDIIHNNVIKLLPFPQKVTPLYILFDRTLDLSSINRKKVDSHLSSFDVLTDVINDKVNQ